MNLGEKQKVDIVMKYKGSVDIMQELAQTSPPAYDAVWPANSLWISLGDMHRRVKHEKSIMTSENDPQELSALLEKIQNLTPGGGTDMYLPARKGLKLMRTEELDKYVPAIILMTDRNSEGSYQEFADVWRNSGLDGPVFGILFGDASEDQLKDTTHLPRGGVFDGRHDLVQAFRKAKGYN
jgi:hypothetical protein